MLQMQRRSSQLNTQLMQMCRQSLKKSQVCRDSNPDPGAYFFQRPFLRGLYWEGLIYKGKFAFPNRLGQPCCWKEIYRFCFVLLCIWGQFPTTSPPGGRGLYLERRFNEYTCYNWPLGERSEPYLAAKRPNASDEVARGLRHAPYEMRRRTKSI